MKFKVEKRGIVTALVLLVLLVAYNVLYFVIPFNRDLSNAAYWITYGLTTFLVVFMGVLVYLGIGAKQLKSRVFGLPILALGYSALVAQVIIDVLVMVVGNFVEFKSWIVVILETLLLVFFFISLIARTAYKDTIDKLDKAEAKETFIKELRINVEVLAGSCSDEKVAKPLAKLLDDLKYADPVSNEAVVEIEDQINDSFANLKEALAASNSDAAIAEINKINSLINERKLRLKAQR